MANGGKAAMMSVSILCIGGVLAAVAWSAPLTIPEIQYTESADGASPYNGKVIDCAGEGGCQDGRRAAPPVSAGP